MSDPLDTIVHINDDAPTYDSSPPLTVADFWSKFPEQALIANKIESARALKKRIVVIEGKVKSGKSLFPRYMAAIHAPVAGAGSHRKIENYFLTSYNRKADREQFAEHRKYHLKVYELYNKDQVAKCITEIIDTDIPEGRQIVLHIDELDYGSSSLGLLSTIWTCVKPLPEVCCVLYSATPEEILKSDLWLGLPASQKECIKFTPSDTYRGDRAFLEAELVEDAEPAFTISEDGKTAALSQQFKAILRRLENNMKSTDPAVRKRYIAVVRMNYEISSLNKGKKGVRKEFRALVVFLKNFAKLLDQRGFAIIYDKHEEPHLLTPHAQAREIAWGTRSAWESFSKPTILLVDQKCTRSTEIKIHDYIDSWHEYRPNYTYTVSVQAEQRVNHYVGRTYADFNKIHVYGSLDTWRLSAKIISEDEYLRKDTEIRLDVADGFSAASFMAFLAASPRRITAVTHLETVSAINPHIQYYRIPTPKDMAALSSALEANKEALAVTAFSLRERTNIMGLAPRVSSTDRTPIMIPRTKFFAWPVNADGEPVEYGDRRVAGTLAHAIHTWRQEVLPDVEGSFNPLVLDDVYEHTLTEGQLKSNARTQTHTLAPDGRYISFFNPPAPCAEYDNKPLHSACEYNDIKDKTTGKETPRQTLVYKDGVLGVYVRIPTTEVAYEPTVLTSTASMYHSRGSEVTRGRGRGRPAAGRGRGGKL
jgi:hypothetical protein